MYGTRFNFSYCDTKTSISLDSVDDPNIKKPIKWEDEDVMSGYTFYKISIPMNGEFVEYCFGAHLQQRDRTFIRLMRAIWKREDSRRERERLQNRLFPSTD